MTAQGSQIIKRWPIYVVFIALIGVLVWALRNDPLHVLPTEAAEPPAREADLVSATENIAAETPVTEPAEQLISNIASENTIATPKTEEISLETIIRVRKTWDPVGMDWYGKEAENFSYRDLKGDIHKLSEYRGKNVLIAFWGTYCPPCIKEVPHLIELRNTISPDELEIIAISSEPLEKIKPFVRKYNVNYTVSSVQFTMPTPYNFVQSIPTSFFIDKEGKFKLIAEGMLSMSESKLIFRAKQLQ